MDHDDALALRLARNLDAAFPDLVAGHAGRLYTIALRLLGDASDAEEVAQDALVRAHRAMAGYSSTRIAELRLGPWLAAIAVNLARNRRRRISDRHPAESIEPMVESGFDLRDDGKADPPLTTLRRESAAELAQLLLGLPPALRSAVVLRHVDGLSVAETAAALGRPEGTVKAQVSRALERLRAMLEAQQSLDQSMAPPGTGRHRSPAAASPLTDVIGGRTLAAEVLR